MSYLTRFILKEWVKAFLLAFIVLILLTTTIELINGFMKEGGDTSAIIDAILIKMPELISKMLPISCLLGTLFSFNKLKQHSELIAILAASFSPKKIYIVIIGSAIIIASLQFYNMTVLLPLSNEMKIEMSEKNKIKRSKFSGGKTWYKGKNYFASFSGFDPKTNSLYDLTLYFYSDKGLTSNIIYSSKTNHIENNYWKLEDSKIYKNLDDINFPNIEKKDSQKIYLSETPDDFKKFESDITTFGFINLYRYIAKLKENGINTTSQSILFFEKFSMPLICIVFALFPLSGIFSPNRRSSSFGKNVVFTLVFTITYWLIYTSFIALGNKGTISPFLSTMLVPLIFIAYIYLIFYKHRKL